MAAVEIAGLAKSFAGTAVLEGVSLDVDDGKFLTLVSRCNTRSLCCSRSSWKISPTRSWRNTTPSRSRCGPRDRLRRDSCSATCAMPSPIPPDVAFHGLNRQRTLLERNIPIDLRPLMDADPGTKQLGFSPTLLSLGQVGDKQTGIGFSLSTPILYYNVALVKAAGRRSRQAAPELERGRGTRGRHR